MSLRRRGTEMKGTLWLASIVLFVASVMVFSSGYATLMAYFGTPTTSGLFSIMGHLMVLLALIGMLGFIMYATERKAGNVKVKNLLFERLLGYAPDAPLQNQTVNQEARR
jgi:hypothetical protein